MSYAPKGRIQVLPSGCWRWLGRTDAYGTPITSYKGRTTRVRTLQYYFKHRRFPARRLLNLATCTPNCCNPEHLFEKPTQKL